MAKFVGKKHQKETKTTFLDRLLEIPIAWVRKYFHNFSDVSKNLMVEMAKRLHNAHIEAEHQSTMTAAQNVACYLQRLCVLYEFNPKDFTLPYSKTLIASRLHIELETFSRAIKRIKQEGIMISGTNVSFVNQKKSIIFHVINVPCPKIVRRISA